MPIHQGGGWGEETVQTHKAKEVGPQSLRRPVTCNKGVDTGDAKGWWDHGGGHVGL